MKMLAGIGIAIVMVIMTLDTLLMVAVGTLERRREMSDRYEGRTCSNCKHHKERGGKKGGGFCMNDKSDSKEDWTLGSEVCIDHEPRDITAE